MCANASLRHRPFAVVAALLALVVPLAIGCGGGKGKVTGNVTVDNKPLPGGTITFHPSKGNAASGEIIDGQYTVTGVPTGNARVSVSTAYLKQEADALGMANQNMSMSMGGRTPPRDIPPEARAALEKEKQRADESIQKSKELRARYRPIPEKYANPDSSGITLSVKSGTNPFDLSLSSK